MGCRRAHGLKRKRRCTQQHFHTIPMHKSLCSLIRSEFKPARSNQERFLSQHIRSCGNAQCAFPNCQALRGKLQHFVQCTKEQCFACASARLTWLHCRGLVSSEFILQFTMKQTEMMQAAMRRKPPDDEEYQNKRVAFMSLLSEMFPIWQTRNQNIVPLALPPTCELPAEAKSVYRTWEQVVHHHQQAAASSNSNNKRARHE